MAKRAVICAGQGAQDVGMGRDLADAFPECKALFDKANDVLGYDLAGICFDGPIEELTKSSHCQPAIFVMSVAAHEALKQRCPDFAGDAAAGLSLGEWTALHLAGSLSFEDTVRVLEARGRFMQEACEVADGAMLSVMGLERDALEAIASQTGIQVANINSASQIVLSGERAGVEAAEPLCSEAGARKTVMLNVAGAFHSELMRPAADRLAEVLADTEFRAPSVPVISNVTAEPHGDPESIRELMVKQVTSSVQWVDTIEWFTKNDVSGVVEVGPGKILSGLVKRIDSGMSLANVADVASLDATVEALSN